MGTSELRALPTFLVLVACSAACTLTGLGDYATASCEQPTGTTSTTLSVGQVPSVSISSLNGANPVATFVASSECVEMAPAGAVASPTCSVFSTTLAPQQPWAIPLPGGTYAAAAVATTAPCTQGQLTFESQTGAGPSSPAQLSCVTTPGAGAALPALVPLPDGHSVLAAWYETSFDSRSNPLGNCAGAKPVPLRTTVASGADTSNPTLRATPTTLSTGSVSVRPPAMTPLYGSSQLLVAAPDGNAVTLWVTSDGTSFGNSLSIPGLENARAVSIASATDNSGRIAIVAELGCAPQTIALALGTVSGGFSTVVTVAPASSARFSVNPTVAWVPKQNCWIVAWISGESGPQALAQRFDVGGNPVGGVVDPSAGAIAASIGSDGNLFAYEPGNNGGSLVIVSLGCP
jgi:hypothetical protein